MKLCPTCDPKDPAVCDFCHFYAFNGDENGAYTGDGRCEHPAHPGPREPEEGCPDFYCFKLPQEAAS